MRYIKHFVLLLILLNLGSYAKAQLNVILKRDTTELVNCTSLRPLDLSTLMKINIAPHAGYWANSSGVPLAGGSIFDPREYLKESPGSYGVERELDSTFYFIITETGGANDYCGIKPGQALQLNLHVSAKNCRTLPDSTGVKGHFSFCFGSYVDVKTGITIPSPYTADSLLFSTLDPKFKSMYKGARVVGVYRDSLGKVPDNGWWLDVQKEGTDSIFVDIRLSNGHIMTRHKVTYTVYPESKLTLLYDVSNGDVYDMKGLVASEMIFQDIDVTSKIKIYVPADEVAQFESYKFYLNQMYLNKYRANGDTTRSFMDIDALMFSGAEDIVAVDARTINGCLVRVEDRLVVEIPLPNVFTPDGDGVNDVLFGGDKFRNREFHLEVFNRWGNMIYQGDKGWDGTYRGEPVPPAVYEYVIILKRADGTPVTYKGTVTLIRKGL